MFLLLPSLLVNASIDINSVFVFMDPAIFEITTLNLEIPADQFTQTTILNVQSPNSKMFAGMDG